MVQDLEQPPAFRLVPVDCIVDFFACVSIKDIGLAHHGSDAAHLEHQPLHDDGFRLFVLRHQHSGFPRQVDQDGSGFENHEIVFFMIDYGWNTAVRVDCQVFRFFLFQLAQPQFPDRICQAGLFEHHRNFPPVWRSCGKKLNHFPPSLPELLVASVRICDLCAGQTMAH